LSIGGYRCAQRLLRRKVAFGMSLQDSSSRRPHGSAKGTAAGHDKLGRLVPGHSEWRARKRRLAVLVEQLAVEYVATSHIARQLLSIAAAHLDQAARARSSALRGRATRLAAKTLGLLERKQKPQRTVTVDDLLRRNANGNANV